MLGWYAEARQVEPAETVARADLAVIGHATIGDVGKRVAESGQLPVQHGDDPGL